MTTYSNTKEQHMAQGSSHEPHFAVLWPLSPKARRASEPAPRLPDLNGKTIVELWDAVYRGDAIYPVVREHIKSVFPRAKFVEYSVVGDFHGAYERSVTAALPEQLRSLGCDAVIVGVGA
jgi:hypothetical protein